MNKPLFQLKIKWYDICVKWQLQYGKQSRNHCFIVNQSSFVSYIYIHIYENIIQVNLYHQPEQNHEQVDSDSFIIENTMEITVFQLFENLPLNTAKKGWCIWIAHTKIEEKYFFAHVKYIPGSISKISTKLTVTVALW